MACTSSLIMFKLENLANRNPLECLVCDQEFASPVRLPCQHSFCHKCIENQKNCPVCGDAINSHACQDSLLTYLIETSHETADLCANCDQISQPMHFCETCQQALCNRCKLNTHQARMFATHRVVPLEERARVKGRITCAKHGEPYILYSVESRTLACIVCFNDASMDSRHHLVNIDAAHKLGCEKLDKVAVKLRGFQDDICEQLQLRKRLTDELNESHQSACQKIRQTCQEMTDTLLSVRDRLLKNMDDEKTKRERHFNEQIHHLVALKPTIQLYLLSASIFGSSASKLDFLQYSNDLLKRIQALTGTQCAKPHYTGDLIVDAREEYSRALEPFLGLSTILMSTGRLANNGSDERSCGTASPRSSLLKRHGSGYAASGHLLLSKYQLVVDLAGAFGEQFCRVEKPLRQHKQEMVLLGKKVQELQRDLTLRRCIIEKNLVNQLINQCKDLDVRVGQHSAFVNDLQPQLQQIWQEQLDRVRRQQVLFREKIEETVIVREGARHVVCAAKQLQPFAVCLAAVTSVIDRKRCHKPEPAPMETICQQINTIEPDSKQRIEAIEKEEQNRRIALDQMKREEKLKIAAVKKTLKTTKEQKKLVKRGALDSTRLLLVNTSRDRSRGGTDHALLTPCRRRQKSSRSHSDEEETIDSVNVACEFTAHSSSETAECVQVQPEISQNVQYCFVVVPRNFSSAMQPFDNLLIEEENASKPVIKLAAECDHETSKIATNDSEQSCKAGKAIPDVPFVPPNIFANANKTACGTWETRERLLVSLKKRVTRIDPITPNNDE